MKLVSGILNLAKLINLSNPDSSLEGIRYKNTIIWLFLIDKEWGQKLAIRRLRFLCSGKIMLGAMWVLKYDYEYSPIVSLTKPEEMLITRLLFTNF